MRALDHESTEFQKVLYQLQRMMGLSKSIPSLRVWDVSAPGLTSRFEARVRSSTAARNAGAGGGGKAGTAALPAAAAAAAADALVLECFHPVDNQAALANQTEMRAFIGKVQEHGVAFPEDGSGMAFVHGDLPDEIVGPEANGAGDALEPDGIRALLICSVLIGRSFPVPAAAEKKKDSIDDPEPEHRDGASTDDASSDGVDLGSSLTSAGAAGFQSTSAKNDATEASSFEIPVGYESICFTGGGKHAPSASALVPYRAEFKTYDPAGVNPRFLITFLRAEVSGADKELLCDNCCSVAADVYCRHEDANLCKGCDKELHNNKFLSKHKRVPLRCSNTQDDPAAIATESNSSLEIFKSKCPFHTNMDVEFFCPECDVPVCIYCKMVGSHSQGEANNHRLIGVRVAWKRAIDEASERDEGLSMINRDLRKQAGNLRRLGQAVDLNEASMIQYIDDMAAKARAEVRAHSTAKRKVLASDAFQIQRRAQELENLGSFLELQKTKLLPVEFITFWGVHKRYASMLASHPVRRPSSLEEVLPDVNVTSSTIRIQTTAPYHPYPYGEDAKKMGSRSGGASPSVSAAASEKHGDVKKKGRSHGDTRRAGAFYSTMGEGHSGESDTGSDSFCDSDAFSDDDNEENSADNAQRRNQHRLSMLSAKMRRKRRSTIVDAAELMEL
jgi:hypothetical protein